MTVLDIGSGRAPSVPLEQRPPDTHYIGLDLSEAELRAARVGVYDEIVVGDAARPIGGLEGRIDLAVSWQVFEHIRPLRAALDNLHTYLLPDATLITLVSGRWACFSVINRIVPDRIGHPLVARLNRREEMNRPVFPAYYDQCSHRALGQALEGWSSVTILPLYRGATYFGFSSLLTRLYLSYENATVRHTLANLATHYLVVATK